MQIQYVSTAQQNQKINSRKFGKLKVLFDNQNCFISLGPDYLFFIPTFSFCLAIAICTILFVNNTSQNSYFKLITCIICGFQPSAYLYIALSNPGIIFQSLIDVDMQPIGSNQIIKKDFKLCKKCNIYVKKFTHHCQECQVCVQEYDHHCPWVSKCIGKNNLTQFYIFLGATTIFIVYSIIAFFICAATEISKNVIEK